MTSIFYTFRDSPQRRRALSAPPGSGERYALYGLDELAARGHAVRHSLERVAPPGWARVLGALTKRGVEAAGGYGGDFATVVGSLRMANRAAVVFSTVDTVGIPLMLARRAGRLRSPLVYTAIGLPERLAQLRSTRIERLYAHALSGCAAVIAYSAREAADIDAWIAQRGGSVSVSFVPFGVDSDALRPTQMPSTHDVVSIGADPHRDFELLLEVARRLPDVGFTIVAATEVARQLTDISANVRIEVDLPFEQMRERLERARVVALPVRENTYSGATTVLLQAMALEKPVVVTRTSAIATGYGLVDGENCRLIRPGDASSFAEALGGILGDELQARSLAAGARRTVERGLSWERYVGRIEEILVHTAEAHSARS